MGDLEIQSDACNRKIPIDATIVDGFDVDDEEERWFESTDRTVLPRIGTIRTGQFRGR